MIVVRPGRRNVPLVHGDFNESLNNRLWTRNLFLCLMLRLRGRFITRTAQRICYVRSRVARVPFERLVFMKLRRLITGREQASTRGREPNGGITRSRLACTANGSSPERLPARRCDFRHPKDIGAAANRSKSAINGRRRTAVGPVPLLVISYSRPLSGRPCSLCFSFPLE